MRVEFLRRFRWHAKPQVVIRYEPGMATVTQACGAEAIAAGAAREVINGKSGNRARSRKAPAKAEPDAAGGKGSDPGGDGGAG